MRDKNNRDNLDYLIKAALDTGAETPDAELVLDTKIKLREKLDSEERDLNMRKNNIVISSFRKTVIIAAAIICMATVTVFAAFNLDLLRPSEIADIMGGDGALSAAFDSDDAININQSAVSDDYIFTLLAIVSGDNLKDTPYYTSELQNERTYIVAAVQNADGTPFADDYFMDMQTFTSFCVVPFVKGYAPWQVNFWGGGGSMKVVDGVLYHLRETADITMFADKGLYLVMSDVMPINNSVLAFDELTGEITIAPDFSGTAAIFELPIDKSLANPEKAAEFLESINYYDNSGTIHGIFSTPDGEREYFDLPAMETEIIFGPPGDYDSVAVEIMLDDEAVLRGSGSGGSLTVRMTDEDE